MIFLGVLYDKIFDNNDISIIYHCQCNHCQNESIKESTRGINNTVFFIYKLT